MHIVIISEYLSSERFIVEKIRQEFPHTTVVIPDYSMEKSTPNKSRTRIKTLSSLIQRGYDKLYRETLSRKLAIDSNRNKSAVSSEYLRVQLNTNEGIQTLQNLDPDVLITCSAPIIQNRLTQLAKIASYNIHFGIAPFYRGNHTLFWTLYFDDFDNVGGCIHHLSNGVDKGNLIAEVYPTLNPGDTELEIEIKITRLLAEAAVNLLHHLNDTRQSPSGKKQLENGRNFKRQERTMGKISTLLLKQLPGKISVPFRKSKVIQHY